MNLPAWVKSLWGSEEKALSPLDLALDQLMQAGAKSGVRVTWQTALQASTAFACARVIANGIAQLPLKLYRARAGGGADEARDHALFDVFGTAVNSWCTSFEWRETSGMHLALTNRSFALINRATGPLGDRAVELLPLPPEWVATDRDNDWLRTRYQVRLGNRGDIIDVDPARILHLRGPSWNAWDGLDGVRLAREAIGLALATEEHGARMFKNGAILGGLLSTDQVLDKDQRDALRQSWKESQEGLANAYKTAVLWGGMKYTPRAQFNDQAQWVEVRRLQIAEVCRFYNIFPIMVGEADKTATYASSEQMFLAHVVHCLGPWHKRIEQRLDLQMLEPKERAAGFFFKFNVRGFLRGSHRDRAEYYRVMHGVGALNANEIRDLEEMNPYAEGDMYLQPMNMVPAGTEPQPAPEPAPAGGTKPSPKEPKQ